jgi:hypothetical protein
MNKLITLPPFCYLLPSSDKQSVTIALHPILALQFYRYLFDLSNLSNTNLPIAIMACTLYIMIIISGFYSISCLIKFTKAHRSGKNELEQKYRSKTTQAILIQSLITLFVFFALVIKTVFY